MFFGRQASNFGRKYLMSLHNTGMSLEDGGSKIYRNVGIYLSNYKVAHSRRQIFKTYYPFSQIIKLLKISASNFKMQKVFSRLEVIINLIIVSKLIYFCVEMEKKFNLLNVCQPLYVWLCGKFQNVYKLLVR